MNKYICENPDCPNYGKEEAFVSETYRLVGDKLQGKNAPCPVCGVVRREINPNESIPISEKNIELAKYTMASSEGRREMLKKRSHEHYEKEVKPYKEHKLREAVSAFKEASKN